MDLDEVSDRWSDRLLVLDNLFGAALAGVIVGGLIVFGIETALGGSSAIPPVAGALVGALLMIWIGRHALRDDEEDAR